MHELGGVDAQTTSELEEVMQVEIALATLDLTEESPVDADLGSHRLLAQTQGMPAIADTFPEDPGRV